MYDLTVIGAGPAGLAAGICAAKLNFKTLVLAKDTSGSQFTTGLEDKRLFGELLAEAKRYPKFLDIKTSEVVAFDQNITSFAAETKRGDIYYSKAAVIACGTTLKLPSWAENGPDGTVIFGKVFDLSLFEGKDTAVVGGSEEALETLLMVSKVSKRLYGIIPGSGYTTGRRLGSKVLALPAVTYLQESQVIALGGKEQAVTLTVRNHQQEEQVITASQVYADAVEIPNCTFENITVKDVSGKIKVGSSCETNVKGLFAAGSATTAPVRTALAAAGHGCQAAATAIKFLLS